MKIKHTRGMFLLLLGVLLLSGCVQEGTAAAPQGGASTPQGSPSAPQGPSSAPAGRLVLLLTDSPAELDITEVFVTISRIDVHCASGTGGTSAGGNTTMDTNMTNSTTGNTTIGNTTTGNTTIGNTTMGNTTLDNSTMDNTTLDNMTMTDTPVLPCAGWSTVVDEEQTFELLSLENVTALLGNATLAPGHYTQIRLYVTEASATIDGEEQELEIPSDMVKLIHPFDITSGETTTLTLDFDARESIHAAGRSGRYSMRPTIRLVVE
ncbi:MAG TPA: DUF4382 domain-containing protein [Candidatus Bilamarchaeaceae archaeon]|nr:DUF4382 domain-containing protein [Candidatus Bilamarchaeaceae archaeon]